jgi:pimeloyl-ACP methyl ester carboxylesterase
MATYVLIHGAGFDSWYWHMVVPELRAWGHDVVAPNLPTDDDSAGLWEYADVVVDAIGDRTDLVVVAQSLAGFTAPLICERVPVCLMILVAAMVPLPGESPRDWWANTFWGQARYEQAKRDGRQTDGDFDVMAEFFHDVPSDVAAQAIAREQRSQSGAPFEKPWPLQAWPDVPTRYVLCRHDRLFPAEFMRRVVQERLNITPNEIDSGHLPALSQPKELAELMELCRMLHARSAPNAVSN